MKKIFFLILFVIFDLSLLAQNKTIIAVFTNWPPYGFIDKQGNIKGFELEIFETVVKKMGMKVDFFNAPWQRCLYMMKTGEADVIISALKERGREDYLFFVNEPISTSETAFFTIKNSHIDYNGDLNRLKGKSIGIINGFSYGIQFDSASYLSKEVANSPEQLVQKLLSARCDIAIGNVWVVKSFLKKIKKTHEVKFLLPIVHKQNLYVAFSKLKDHLNLSEKFNIYLMQYKQTSHYRKVLKKYDLLSFKT